MKHLYKTIFLSILCIFLLSSCAFSAVPIGVNDDDPRIKFETFAKGFSYVDKKNFISQKSGYDDEVIINNQEDLESLESKLDIEFSEDIDFEEYMLYANFDGNIGNKSKITSYNIKEIAYNENIIVVIINYDNSETIEAEDGEWLCFYNISKIKKEDFPYEPRDFLCIPDKGNKNNK